MSRSPDIPTDFADPHPALTLEDVCHIYINTKSTYNYENLYSRQFYQRMQANVFPYIGYNSIQHISSSEISDLFNKVNKKSRRLDLPYKVLGQLYQVFDYAIDRQFYFCENPVRSFIYSEMNDISDFDNDTINYLNHFMISSENDDTIESLSARISVLTAMRLRLLLSLRRMNTVIDENLIIKIRRVEDGEYRSFRAISNGARDMFQKLPSEGMFIFCPPESVRPIGQKRISEHFSNFKKLHFHLEMLPFVFDKWVSKNFGHSHIVEFIRESDVNWEKSIAQQAIIMEQWERTMQGESA